MIEILLLVLLILGFILLTSGTGEKEKTKPPPLPRPTDRDLVVEEMVLGQFGGAIASMTSAGRVHLAEQIRQLSPKDKPIK